MTTFFLHGGKVKKNCNNNVNFFQEIKDNQTNNYNDILFVPFALEDKSFWEEYQNYFEEAIGNMGFSFNFIKADENNFYKQLSKYNTIYFTGGDEDNLKKYFSNIGSLNYLLKGKTIVGSSAGANIWSRYYFSNDKQSIEEGLGVLDIKSICHYNEEINQDKAKILENHNDNLHVYKIKEADYFKINI